MTGTSLQIVEWLMAQPDKTLVYDIDVHTKERSISANNYFWKLVNLVAVKEKISDTEVHDKILAENRHYIHTEEGAVDWKVSNRSPDKFGIMKEKDADGKTQYYVDSEMKVKLQREDGSVCHDNNGDYVGTIYWHIKGTHQMNSKELSRCIDSIKFEATQLGIPTMPENELERLLKMWGKKHDDKNK